MKGFFKKALKIDLSNRKYSTSQIDTKTLKKCLGGKGLATSLLLENNPAGVNPFSPENNIIIATGPATQSPIYGSERHGIFSKSPLTGCYGESYSGGKLASAISNTGYDAIIITGKADHPLWLEITDYKVIFHNADCLWGKETYNAEKEVKRMVPYRNAGVMVIGPAGEKLIRFALVKNDRWRSAGRCGMGAIFGSKKVKALAFHGNQRRNFDQKEELTRYSKKMLLKLKNHPLVNAYRKMGTPMMVDILNQIGAFPTRYWSEGKCHHINNINSGSIEKNLKVRPSACLKCFMACGKRIEVKKGRHKGLKIEGPEYETIYSFGGLCEIDKIEEIVYLNDLCDRLGIDTISAGNLVSFAIEASKRGKIKEKLEYGNADIVADIINKIVKKEGIGNLLSEGIRTAAFELKLDNLAIHVKGMEPPGYDPRVLKGMGLSYAVSDRGACHLRSTFYKAEISGLIEPEQIEGKAEMLIDFEDRCTLFDCLILCRFYRDFYLWQELSNIISMITGLNMNKDKLIKIAASISDNAHLFNLREGLTYEDDSLPKRFINERLPSGHRITSAEINTLVHDYYQLRGWSAEGTLPLK